MKTNAIRNFAIAFTLFGTTLFSSCDDDSQQSLPHNTANLREKTEKVLDLREDLNFISRFIDTNVVDPGSEEGRKSLMRQPLARVKATAPCAAETEEELPDGSLKITLDFKDGCETEDGIEVAGKVIMIFRFTETAFEFELEFLDYTELGGGHEGEIVVGIIEGKFTLDLEASTFVQEMKQDLTVHYANNTEANYRITQKAAMTETGLRVTTLTTSGNLADGNEFATTLSKALIYDFSCETDYPVRGEELFTLQGNTILVSYGNGTCDNDFTVK